MKIRELLLTSLAMFCLIAVSVSLFKVYASAERRLDQVLVENVTFDVGTKKTVSKETLLAAAHVNKIPQVTKVDVTNLECIKNNKPGTYEVTIQVYIQFDEVITRQINVQIVDKTQPVITQKKELIIPQNAKIDWNDYFSIDDTVDGFISLAKSKISEVDTKKVGKQTVVISAEDKAGNNVKKEFAVEIFSSTNKRLEKAGQLLQKDLKNTTAPKTAKSRHEEKNRVRVKSTEKNEFDSQAKYTSVIQFNGQKISYIHATGANTAPDEGAATWLGKGFVDDGAPTHFIGHNPGDFATVMELYVGAPITVYDDNGEKKTYHVYEVVDVTDEGYNANDLQDDVLPRMLDEKSERISLQTCITDQINRCVLAR